MAKIPPNKVPANNAGSAGTFFIISNSTITGTKNNHGLMLKLLSIAINKFVISSEFCVLSIESPMNKKMRSDMTKLGIVVYIMYLIWVNKSVPAIAGARFVVSDKGDILSPKYAPDIISHGGLSVKRLVGFQWFDQEAIFGIPIGVSVDFIFLFVLFGALLETAGGGKYFLDLAFAMVGKMRGGPAKAAILGSGMTGMISGSSIANTVTTGTFTIPIMKNTGFSKEKAGAIEVSSSVNGQIMPPVMGAAAFVMASFIGVTYFEVVKHAFLPAIISYIALFYISHLEALKLNLKGMDENDIPKLKKTFFASFCSGNSF